MKYISGFLDHLMDKAAKLRDDAGWSGSMGDNGAGLLEAKVQCYRAGMEDTLPYYWVQEYNEYEQQANSSEREVFAMTEQELEKEINAIMEWAKQESWFRLALLADWRDRSHLPPEWMMEN